MIKGFYDEKLEEEIEVVTKEILKPTKGQIIDYLLAKTLLFCLLIITTMSLIYHII